MQKAPYPNRIQLMELEEKRLRLLEKIKEVYPANYEAVIKNLREKESISFRINTLKAGENEFQENQKARVLNELTSEGFEINPGPIAGSFLCTKNSQKRLSESNVFNKHEIYIQDLSSMIPALVLGPKENETVIDLCAAPGSKTTQIADLTLNKATIYAVESARERFFALKRNLADYGVSNANLILANSIGLDRKYPNFTTMFDKVLVDAPCTNEARMDLANPKTYQFWNPKKYKEMSRVQKGILITGIRLMKEGGTLIYSTCTFNPEENELVIDWLLDKFPELSVEKIELKEANTKEGFTNWKDRPLDPKIKNTLRILPNELFSGFFIAKIKK